MRHKTTHKDFLYFSERVKHWVQKLGLTGYEVTLGHSDLKEEVLACIRVDLFGKGAYFILGKNWGADAVTKTDLDRTAFHEVIHLLLYAYQDVVDRRLPEIDVSMSEHGIIRRLENMVFGI